MGCALVCLTALPLRTLAETAEEDAQRSFKEYQRHRAKNFPSEWERERAWAEIYQEADRIKKERADLEDYKESRAGIKGQFYKIRDSLVDAFNHKKEGSLFDLDRNGEPDPIGIFFVLSPLVFTREILASVRSERGRVECRYIYGALAPAFPRQNQVVRLREPSPAGLGHLSPPAENSDVSSSPGAPHVVRDRNGALALLSVTSDPSLYREPRGASLIVQLSLRAPFDPQHASEKIAPYSDREYAYRTDGALFSLKEGKWAEVSRDSKEFMEVTKVLVQIARHYAKAGPTPPREMPGRFNFTQGGSAGRQTAVGSVFVAASDPSHPKPPPFAPPEMTAPEAAPPRLPTMDASALKQLEEFDFDAILKGE